MNKSAGAALEVHAKWLKAFFSQPLASLPKDLHVRASRLLIALLQAQIHTSPHWAWEYVRNEALESPAASSRFLFALACAAAHKKITRDYWRSDYEQQWAIPFLKEISACGYQLADFEKDLIEQAGKKESEKAA